MASLANDMRVQGKPAAKAPLAAHPAFPFIVALWFAALLGLGSLVVPVPVIERIVVATGIAGIVPAATPPLGFTARALMALAFTFGGAMAGLLIARQVARANNAAPVARMRTPLTNADRKPIFAHAELGGEGLDGRSLTPRGRRSLAIDNEERPSDFLELAPMPGTINDLGPGHDFGPGSHAPQPELQPRLQPAAVLHAGNDELELTEFHLADEPAEAFGTAVPGFSSFDTDIRNDTMDGRQIFERPHDDTEHTQRQEFRYSVDPVSQILPAAAPAVALTMTNAWSPAQDAAENGAADEIADAESAAIPATSAIPVDALQFSPPSLARQLFAADPVADETGEFPHNEEDEEADVFEDHHQSGNATLGAPVSDMADVGLVQLAQRLGASIEKRRELLAARAALEVAAAAPVLAEEFDMAAPDEAAQAMAAYFSRPPAAQPAEAVAELDTAAEDPAEEDSVEEDSVGEDAAEEDAAETGMPTLSSITPTSLAPASNTPRAKASTGPRQVFEPLAGLARIDIDEDDEEEDIDELAASFSLPLGRSTIASARPTVAIAPEIAADPIVEAYEAPLPQAVFHSKRQQFVRIEDEPEVAEDDVQPAVVFPAEAAAPVHSPAYASFSAPASAHAPGHSVAQPAFESEAYQTQARVHTEEHERALRDALLNLQRMSGTA